jgi:predicted AAA+ superfamily ATPase
MSLIMQRDALIALKEWRFSPQRKPLLIRGARQVGKSWLVDEFGKYFDNYIKVNFDKEKSVKTLFAGDLFISKIIEELSLYSRRKIQPGNTLLFLDEIQECENAIKALRYFKEDYPELHVIAAGSLIDFKLKEIGMPVGRVQYLYLNPLSFGEFLNAYGREDLRAHLFQKNISTTLHTVFLDLLKNYLWIGGMPAAIMSWLTHKDVSMCHAVQDEIIQTYFDDFAKYARKNQIPLMEKVFKSTPSQIGKKFKFSNVDKDIRALYLKNSLELLEHAGIVHICHHTNAQQIPLGAESDDKKFKVFFFDVGLAQRVLGLDMKQWVLTSIKVDNIGAIAEQLVAQELIAYAPFNQKSQLYYWHRENKSTNAEVDFIIKHHGEVIPIEVKSSAKGHLKSLHLYLNTHPRAPYGVRISEIGFSKNENILNVPLYGIESFLKSDLD